MSDSLFDSVDALLAAVDSGAVLPVPAERVRLREAAGLTVAAVAQALKTRTASLESWEGGRTEPTGDKREAYRRLLEGLAAKFPATPAGPQPPSPAPTGPAPAAPAAPTAPAAAPEPAPAPAAPPVRRRSAPGEPAEANPFPDGPLLVLDGDGQAYGVDGLVLTCPATTVPALAKWALGQKLGTAPAGPGGFPGDPLIVLTAAAAARLGLPSELADRQGLRLPADHKVVKALAKADWETTRRGFGPWTRLFKDPKAMGRRYCVQLAVLPWGALDSRSWGDTAALPAPQVARILGAYAALVTTPRGSTGASGLALMTDLRPAARSAYGPDGSRSRVPAPGALHGPVDPAPPEAPPEHPVAVDWPGDQFLDEEAYDWICDPKLLPDEQCLLPFAVGIDINLAFLAATSTLTVGLGGPTRVTRPAFDKKLPGSWLVDLSGIDLDPRLPSPFTPHGERPTGPAWYATPTVAYAVELGHPVQPVEAFLRHEHGRYLEPWYARLRGAYLAVMAEAGVVPGMDPAAFLAAMELLRDKRTDPVQAVLLAAIKSTAKGAIGKMRERAQGSHRAGERWYALDRETWRPDIRAAVISTARVGMHRKINAMARTGRFPIAVLSDCVVYPSAGPSPLDLLPYDSAGKPLRGGFTLGVNPGYVKHEGTMALTEAIDMVEPAPGDGDRPQPERRKLFNPARHVKSAGRDDDE